MVSLDPLDHTIWNALNTGHRALARVAGDARRFPDSVSPLAALRELTPGAYADLATLVRPDEEVALFTLQPIEAPRGWRIVKARYIDQMVCLNPVGERSEVVRPLGDADVPEMLALTAATKPGPFARETIRMGRYFGIRTSDGKLAAMAGERLKLDALQELSAVCTDPEFRGRGYGRMLVSHLIALLREEGRTPFLHVKGENEPAKSLYEQLGFHTRRPIQYSVLTQT